MNYKQEQLRYDEIEFSFGRIIRECKKNIKWIVICAVICALLLPALVYCIDFNEYKENSQVINEEQEYTFSEAEELAIDNYLKVREKKEQMEEYGEKSILLQIDWKDVYTGKVQYFIQAEDKEVDKVVSAYINLLTKEYLVEIFTQEFGLVNVDDINQIVRITGEDGFLTIEVKAENEELCIKYLNVLKDIIFNQEKIINNQICQHQIQILQEKIRNSYSNELYVAQISYIQSMNEINTTITNMEYYLTNLQKAFITEQMEDNAKPLLDIEKKPTINLLFVLIGAVGGGIVGLILVCVITVFDGKLQTENELNKRFGISRLAVISFADKSGLDEKKMETISVRIKSMIEQNSVKEVCFIGSTNILVSEEIHKICDILMQQDISCKIVNDILINEDTVNDVMKKNIVLIEEVAKSKIKDIYRIANLCNDVRANIIGYICIDNYM